jgi:hypothetical protein
MSNAAPTAAPSVPAASSAVGHEPVRDVAAGTGLLLGSAVDGENDTRRECWPDLRDAAPGVSGAGDCFSSHSVDDCDSKSTGRSMPALCDGHAAE